MCVCASLSPWVMKVIPVLCTRHVGVCLQAWLWAALPPCTPEGRWGTACAGENGFRKHKISLLDKAAYISILYILSPVNDWKRGNVIRSDFCRVSVFTGSWECGWGLSTPPHLSDTGHMTLPVTWPGNLPAGKRTITSSSIVFTFCPFNHLWMCKCYI